MNTHEIAKKHEKYMIDLRRHFHMYPEISMQEEKTSLRVQQELTEMGIPFEVVGHRNVVAWIDTGRAGKKLAIRGDMDALPMDEEIESEFKSKVPGAMHACGHDVHTACLLAAAKGLLDMKDELNGMIYLCFQVAEEVSGPGPKEIIDYLNSVGGVDEVISNHMAPSIKPYETSVMAGPSNAGNCQWRITVHGRGGHGSRPDLSIDPIRPAAQIVGAITSIPSNYHPAFNPLVISPCMIHAGTAYNIIPDECYIEGNIRYFHAEELEEVLHRMDQIAKSIAASVGATAECVKIAGCAPVENDPEVTAKVVRIMKDMGLTIYTPENPNMGSDDFGAFTQAYPGCYFNFGASSDRPDAAHNLHNTKLFYDENGFLPIVEFFLRYAEDLLK